MSFSGKARRVLLSALLVVTAIPALAQQTVRVVGTVRDETNAISLPGVPVEVVGTKQVVYTDVDGRYTLELTPGMHQVKVALEGYQDRTITVDTSAGGTQTLDVGLTMNRFAETVTVTASVVDVVTSSAEAQLIERRQAQVITDNVGAQEMKNNGDSDAAAAMSRVPGLSIVDNQFVFIRGLGERYSNTTLAGSVLPTTEPDKKVVPLDLFPSGLIDSVQVSKSYSPDKSAEFAGGLVQIVPLKLPSQPVLDFSYGMNFYSTATGKSILLSPLGSRDWWGFDNGARAMPSGIPSTKIVRRGIYTPEVGYPQPEMDAYGRLLENAWSPVSESGRTSPSWSATFGDRFNKLGIVASASHSYKEQYAEEERRFFRVESDGVLEATSDYAIKSGVQRAQLGIVGNIAYQFTPNQRITVENFYTHSGRDEGRSFEGPNFDNAFLYRNSRVYFMEEGMLSNAVGGEHFFRTLSNSRFDWRVNYARATRDEPDMREVLYQSPLTGTPNFVLADESQSGFRMFNELTDDSTDVAGNWSVFNTSSGRPTQYKFGMNYVERNRDFSSRRFRFIPIRLTKDGPALTDERLPPEQLYTPENIGTAFRFNEETRTTDAYLGDQKTTAGYGMVDFTFAARTRMIAGLRVERFNQLVETFDQFGLDLRVNASENKNTDFFPSVNFVQGIGANSNLRLGYSQTVNRPEFRELAEFEFTDVVGNRATIGNPDLERALIQNVDGRWEMFTGGRNVLAASVFYKYFDQPIERVVIAGATPLASFQNAENARNFGVELEAGQQFGPFFMGANYTFVDSKITLAPQQRSALTSLERPLAGQSENLFNLTGEFAMAGFTSRILYNFVGDRISDVGANSAPDIIEEGRGVLDVVVSQRLRGLNVRLTLENLTDTDYLFTQIGAADPQRLYKLGRTIGISFGYNVF